MQAQPAGKTQIFDREDRRGAGVAPAERVDLPDAVNEFRNMRDNLRERQPLITELLFPVEVMIQRPADLIEADIQHRIAEQHPFALGEVVFAELPGELENAIEDSLVDGGITDGREGKGLLVEQLRDVGGNLVGFLLTLITGVVVGFCSVIGLGFRHSARWQL